MRMFFPSMYRSSRRPCLNASMRADSVEGNVAPKNPMRAIFVVCCASADPAESAYESDGENPRPFSILDFRFWIVGKRCPGFHMHLFFSVIENRQSKI